MNRKKISCTIKIFFSLRFMKKIQSWDNLRLKIKIIKKINKKNKMRKVKLENIY